MAVVIFFCWYYPIGMYRNAIPAHQVHERGGLMFLFVLVFMLFTSTFTDMVSTFYKHPLPSSDFEVFDGV